MAAATMKILEHWRVFNSGPFLRLADHENATIDSNCYEIHDIRVWWGQLWGITFWR